MNKPLTQNEMTATRALAGRVSHKPCRLHDWLVGRHCTSSGG